jgi:ATP/maltotriose-dependent transcriptional regulator MalT
VDPIITQTLADARATGDRRLEQAVVRAQGLQVALQGEPEEGRRLVDQGRAILEELGLTIEGFAASQNAARIALLEGDLDEAARELRVASEELDRLGETAFLSTNAAVLAVVELRRGDRSSAERWLEVAERTASPGDLGSQIQIAIGRGMLSILHGGRDTARDHLHRAEELANRSDSKIYRGETLLDVAEAFASIDPEEATRIATDALRLAEAKGLSAYEVRANVILSGIDAPGLEGPAHDRP